MKNRYRNPANYKARRCPGCSTVGPLPENMLCETCQDQLKDYRRFRAQIDQLKERETSCYFIGQRAPIPKLAPWAGSPSPRDDEDRSTPGGIWFGVAFHSFLMEVLPNRAMTKDEERFGRALINTQSYDGPARELNHRKDGYIGFTHAVEMTDGAHAALNQTYKAINAMLQESFRAGQERGQDLLQQLASGECTAGSFDKHLEEIARNRAVDADNVTRHINQSER